MYRPGEVWLGILYGSSTITDIIERLGAIAGGGDGGVHVQLGELLMVGDSLLPELSRFALGGRGT